MALFILSLFIYGINGYLLQNKTKLRINNEPICGPIEISFLTEMRIMRSNLFQKFFSLGQACQRVKIVFTSLHPIEVILHTTTGIPLYFKGTKISYTGHPTYYQINNINQNTNKISFDIYEIDIDWIKVLSVSLTVLTFLILIFYKRDHRISKLCLLILLSMEILKLGNRFPHDPFL